MLKIVPAIFTAALLVATTMSAPAQTAGDWVLGDHKGSGYWFSGIAKKIEGNNIKILYDDGGRETVNISKVRPYDWVIGMPIQCNYQGKGDWYPGTIASLAGEKIGIAYNDGDKETTKTGRCRSL